MQPGTPRVPAPAAPSAIPPTLVQRLGREWLPWAPVALSMLFTAIALLPELRRLPNLNDDAFHFLLVQEASATLARGGNVFDFWSPVLELGFPQFLYYQHLPHLFVVFVERLLPGADLLTTFNGVRYALLVGFPLTVYWSLTRLGFSREGSLLAAALSPLFSGNFGYGFEYDSYVWRGFGMYTQLWAMHLSLLALALLADFLDHGRRRLAAVAALSALILSHVVYAYMTAISAVFFLLWGLRSTNARVRILRFGLVWGLAALVTAYFWWPFLSTRAYLLASPNLEPWKYDSFGAAVVLQRLASGELFDHGRWPVVTVLVAAGLVAAFARRSALHWKAAAFFLLWMALYFGRPTWGPLADALPLHDGLLMHRFVGSVDIAALMLIAAGGTWLWHLASRTGARAPALYTLLAIALMIPALVERARFHRVNETLMARTAAALEADADAAAILDQLASLPPGRAFAGLRTDWGKRMKLGELAFSDLLTFRAIPAVAPPYQALSLNADLIWHFDYQRRVDYELFNVRYVVAPADQPMPAFLEPIDRRGRYALYRHEPGSYFAIGRSDVALHGAPVQVLPAARAWLQGPMAASFAFPRVRLTLRAGDAPDAASRPLTEAAPVLAATPLRPRPAGVVLDEASGPGRHAATVQVGEAAVVVAKVTYHPNWRATINGVDAATTMVMPSFVGIEVPPGRHDIAIVYRSSPTKTLLLFLGAATLLLVVALELRQARVSARRGRT